VNRLKIRRVRHVYTQEIVGSSRHQIALADLAMLADRSFKTAEILLRLPFQRNLDDDGNALVLCGIVHKCRVATDDPVALEHADASEAGRGGEAHLGGELRVCNACIAFEYAQDVAVDTVQ